jgi:hypothetical protein
LQDHEDSNGRHADKGDDERMLGEGPLNENRPGTDEVNGSVHSASLRFHS